MEEINTNQSSETVKSESNDQDDAGTSYKVIFKENTGWGYQIFDGSKMLINQEHIPAVQGTKGFETKEHAEIAAKFILNKIDNGIFPPTISPQELDSLGVYSLPESK